MLAQDLGVSLVTLDQLVRDLVRLGHLRSMEFACPDRCGGCPLAGACASQPAFRQPLLARSLVLLLAPPEFACTPPCLPWPAMPETA